MPEWRYTGMAVSDEKGRQALAAVKSACFNCKEHSDDCPLAKAAGEITRMTEENK